MAERDQLSFRSPHRVLDVNTCIGFLLRQGTSVLQLLHCRQVPIYTGQAILPVTSAHRHVSEREIRPVDLARPLCHGRPRCARFPVVLDGMIERYRISRLPVNIEKSGTAYLSSEESGQSNFDQYIFLDAAKLRRSGIDASFSRLKKAPGPRSQPSPRTIGQRQWASIYPNSCHSATPPYIPRWSRTFAGPAE